MHSPGSSCCAASPPERRPDPTRSVIELSDVCYAYGDEEVLSDINLVIRAGDFLTIIGPNGEGPASMPMNTRPR